MKHYHRKSFMHELFYSRKRYRGIFTLIELLIVIAIIAILASMMMPALKKARESAKKVQCMGNLKQLGAAVQLYTLDNNGWALSAKMGPSWWSHYLKDYTGTSFLHGAGGTVYWCPSETRSTTADYTEALSNPTELVIFNGPSYSYTFDGSSSYTAVSYFRPDKVKNPSQKIVIADGFDYYAAWGISALYARWNGSISNYSEYLTDTNKKYTPTCRHQKRFNAVYVDAHVKDDKAFGTQQAEYYEKFDLW